MLIKIISFTLTFFIVYMSMVLASMSYGFKVVYFWNFESLIVVLFPSYFLSVFMNGKFMLDVNGLKFMKKIVMPISWVGFLIGIITLSFGVQSLTEPSLSIIFQAFGISLIVLLYGMILKIIITTLIKSKT